MCTTVVGPVAAARGGTEPATLVDQDISYIVGGGATQTLDVYRQDSSAAGRPSIVLVHGGGFAAGSPDDLARQARLAASHGWVAFNVDYRTTSVVGTDGSAWPTELEDVKTAVAWVRGHARDYGADPTKLAILGVSAGGTLSALAAADRSTGIRASAMWSGPTDLAPLVPGPSGVPPGCAANTQCTEFWSFPWVTDFLGCAPSDCPERYAEASPLTYASAMPPTFVANGTSEVVPLPQAQALVDELEGHTITNELEAVPGALHGHTFTEFVWNDTIRFLATELGVPVPEPIDFGESPLDLGWATVAIVLALVGIVVAIVARVASDRRQGQAP
jgi:acetyl esterase/lipase